MFSRLRRLVARFKRDNVSDEEKKRFVRILENYARKFPNAKTIGELRDEIIKHSREVQRIEEEKRKERERRKVGYIA